jgi:hypothetical protein
MAAEATIETPTEVQDATAAPTPASAELKAPAKKASKAEPQGKDANKGGKGEKQGKGKKKGKDKGADDADAGQPAGDGPSIAGHPRAARAVARAKSWGGLAGFVLAGYLSLPTNTLAAAGLRALIAGVVCYVATWAGAVFLWRRLVMLEIKAREHKLMAARARRELPPGSGERPGASAAS